MDLEPLPVLSISSPKKMSTKEWMLKVIFPSDHSNQSNRELMLPEIWSGLIIRWVFSTSLLPVLVKRQPRNHMEFEKDKSKQTGINTSLAFKLNEKMKISPFLRYTVTDSDFDADAFTDADKKYESEYLNTGGSWDFKYQKFRARIGLSHTQSDRLFITSFGETPFAGRLQNLDSNAAYDVGDKLTLLGGINYQRQKMLDTMEIMYETGYKDLKSFRNTFKKVVGISPSAYRGKYARV